EEAAAVLLAVELLHHEFVAVAGPFHAGQVMLHRVTGDMHPAGAGGGHIDHADAGRGRIVAHFGILHRDDIGVYRIGGVEHEVGAGGRGVDLPVGEGAPVGAPAEAVPAEQLFLVGPVEGAVDNFFRTVRGQLRPLPGLQVFHIQVMTTDIGGARTVGG